ncbi:unnamed protein product [marine sediment metagenome]|uniref:Uncharacterized protein n=1 Tax=marine sediment metagenome TaxID=412755 RepID=X0UYZ7_9ZZZZ
MDIFDDEQDMGAVTVSRRIDMGKKCKYRRPAENVQYTPDCTGNTHSVHPQNIIGRHCQFCGKKIKTITLGD